jgi:hypothetical protein
MPSRLRAVSIIASMEFPCLLAQLGPESPDHQDQMMIILQNCGDEDITLPRCSNIENIENVKNPYFDQICEVMSGKLKSQ